MKLHAQITKVDAEKRLVWGVATEEVVDKSGEIFDYAKSKPYFEAWSAEVAKDTDGKSLGNVRAMHGKVSAGVLKALEFDDAAKRVIVCGKIVDDNEWSKVLEGCYTGYSIGGAYVNKVAEKMDGKDVTRYVANPSEISIVDRPCVPTAKFFDVQKADGTIAQVEFKKADEDDPEEEGISAEEKKKRREKKEAESKKAEEAALAKAQAEQILEVEGTDEQVRELATFMAAEKLNMGAVLKMLREVKAAPAPVVVVHADAAKLLPITTEAELLKVHGYAAMPVLSKRLGDELPKVQAAIAEQWAKLGKKAEELPKVEKLSQGQLKKGLMTVAWFAQLLNDLCCMVGSVEWEQYAEGDDTGLCQAIRAEIGTLGTLLQRMVAEEIAEEVSGTEADKLAHGTFKAELLGKLEPLTKLIKAEDAYQKIHDMCKGAGAACAAEKVEKLDPTSELAKALGAIELLKQDIEILKKQPMPSKLQLHLLGAAPVKKSQDTGMAENGEPAEPAVAVVKDAHGEEHGAATVIKALHQAGQNRQ